MAQGKQAGGSTDRPGRASDLPASVEVAWGLRERPGKGPRPGLDLDRIVGAAVRIAEAEGLAAVSMGRVAKELGVSTMSLYRYVAAKDELYVLMQEAAMGLPPAPPAPGTPWREVLTAWATALRDRSRRNLWAMRIPVDGPPATPHSVAWMEQGLASLDGSGLGDGDRISVIMLVSGFVRNEVGTMADLAAAQAKAGTTPEESLVRYGRLLARFTDPVRFPAVTRLLEAGVLEGPDDPDYEFAFGLERLLDGIEALVRKRGVAG
ncbi:TetR family transcriptional regulator [Streptomyces spiroverticillatus]|uniref:TetR family transcriptional regulator n=1 Tax=Streptomyces finlayi TaxID=67296 RepID=A0A919C8C1_9ACTN|nr:TetR/AcrR family transcriptional regulator [Streptomyces finlayi]GGZ97078.1 TetR family transcriptional regulator [Streptomyces spiroverticillatus]GHC82301.1 TetR family transcriptional regulator [Streptomyces finlayi]